VGLTALNALMAPVLTRTTGDGGVSINLMPACTGTQCGSATCQLHAVVTGWALSSACVLTNNGMSAGQSPPAIVADLCYPTCAAFSSSPSYNWAYATPPGGDTTSPNKATGLTGTAGTGQVTLTLDGSTDPHGIVNRTGVKDYLTYLNGVLIDTYTAPTPGLDLAFTAAAIGVTTGSATQSSAPAGNQWSITNNGGTGGGLENNQNTSVYAITTPVSGTALCGRMGFNSITTAATYGKAPRDSATAPRAERRPK
jgi:hypothetical protein